jgi:beta-glucosidase-like glycosyl hydrolase
MRVRLEYGWRGAVVSDELYHYTIRQGMSSQGEPCAISALEADCDVLLPVIRCP